MSASRPTLALFFALLLAAPLAASMGCGESGPPPQPINFANGILNMSISQDWVLQRDAGKRAYYKHRALDGVKLSFENQTADYGTPMTVGGVRGAIGSELNLRYGGVEAKLGYGGCAVLSYKRKVQEGSKNLYTQNWVVAHPYGYGAVARVAITLEAPDGHQSTPEFQEIVSVLDRQVGDAKMPEA
jgi:hypothetical protein